MKKLFLLGFILIGINLFAQDQQSQYLLDSFMPSPNLSVGITSIESSYALQFRVGTPPTKVLSVSEDSSQVHCFGAELITLKLLLQYQEECYADSTYVEYFQYHSSVPEDGLSTLAIYTTPTLVKEWKHKEPTFADFLNWVKIKLN